MTVGYESLKEMLSLKLHTMLYCQWFVDDNKRSVLLLWPLGMTFEGNKSSDISYYAILSMVFR